MTHLSNDLDWIAFCYWKDELADEQRDWFEGELEENQLAREALARAVETTEAIKAVKSLESPTRKSRQKAASPAVWWMTVGAALSLCAVFIAKSIRNESVAKPAPNDVHATQISLALAWDEMRVRLRSELELLWGDEESGDAELEPETNSTRVEELSVEPDLPPSWMESALLGMAEDDQDDEEWEGLP